MNLKLIEICFYTICALVLSACGNEGINNQGQPLQEAFVDQSADGTAISDSVTAKFRVLSDITDSDALVLLPFDEGVGETAYNSVNVENDGQLVNGPVYASDTVDNSSHSLRFDGNDDFVDLGAFDVDGAGLTLAAWFKADSFTGKYNDGRLISKASGVSGSDHIFMLSTMKSDTNVRLRARVRVGGVINTLVADSGNLTTGDWYHAAMTYDESVLRLYLNGEQVGSSRVSGPVDKDPAVSVSVAAQPPGAGGRYFDGSVDAVGIWQRALESLEIAELVSGEPIPNHSPEAIADSYVVTFNEQLNVDFVSGVLTNDSDGDLLTAVMVDGVSAGDLSLNANGSFTYTPKENFLGVDGFSYYVTNGVADSTVVEVTLIVESSDVNPDPDLLVHLSMDDDQTASVATDSSVNGNNGTITGAIYEFDSGDGSVSSLMFDGAGSVNLGKLDAAGTGLTLAAWIRADSFPGRNRDPRIISKARNIATDTHTFMLSTVKRGSSNDTVLQGRVRVRGVTKTYRANTGALSPGVWYHAAMVYDESSMKLYLDGIEIASTDVFGPVAQDSLSDVVVGANPSGGYNWDGNIDDVVIAQYPYSASDILGLATGELAVKQTPVALVDNDSVPPGNTVSVESPANEVPVASTDVYNMTVDAVLSVNATNGVLFNDVDIDGELTAVLAPGEDVSNGTLVLNDDGSFVYTPDSNFAGIDSFSYSATDGEASSEIVEVRITVVKPSTDPVLLVHLPLDDHSTPGVAADSSVNGNDGVISSAVYDFKSGDGSASSLSFDGSGSVNLGALDVDGSGLTLAAWIKADSFPGPNRDPRIISKSRNISTNSHVFMLSTTKRGSSSDTVLQGRVRVKGSTRTYRANSGALETGVWYHAAMVFDGSTMKLYLDGVEIASTDINGTVVQDNISNVFVGGNPSGGYGWDGNIDGVTIAEEPYSAEDIQALASGQSAPHAIANSHDAQMIDGVVSAKEQNSAEDVQVTASELIAPDAIADSYDAQLDEQLLVTATNGVLANDTFTNQSLVQSILTSDVSNGTLSLSPDGAFTYTPEAGFSGIDSFSYIASLGSISSVSADVTLNVFPPPNAVDDTFLLDEDTTFSALTGGVLQNDVDPNAPDDLMAELVTSPVYGTLIKFSDDGKFTYAPASDFHGSDSFTYRAIDGETGSDQSATVYLSVNSINDMPMGVGDLLSTTSSTPMEINLENDLFTNDSDVDGDSLTLDSFTQPNHGTLIDNKDGSLTYTPAGSFAGTDLFEYRLTDGSAISDLVTVIIDVITDSDALFSLALDEGAGTMAVNSISSKSDGQLVGGPTYSSDAPDGSDHSLRFDGTNDYIDLGSFDANGSGLTLALWFKADSFPGYWNDSRLISKATGVSGDEHIFMLSTIRSGTDIRLRARIRVGGVTQTLIATTGNLSTDVWYHATLSHNGKTLSLYLDGQLVGSSAVSGPVEQAPDVAVSVAAQPPGAGGRYFHGNLDAINIWQRALDESEVSDLVRDELLTAKQTTDTSCEQIADTTEVQTTPLVAGTKVELLAQSGSLSVTEDPDLPVETSEQSPENPSVEPAKLVPSYQTTKTEPVLGASNASNSLAFPGALGWAADTTTGGRGGKVVIVDSLSNVVDPTDGVTTFREAMTEINEPRIIVFSVAGLIDYRSGPTIPESVLRVNNTDNDVTIACQSAPPPGVTFMGDGMAFGGSVNNVIMRHCRFRNSDAANVGSAENSSCVRVTSTNKTYAGEVQHNFILDHVSCMWSTDDAITFFIGRYAHADGGHIENITLSNSMVAEGDADSLHSESGQIPNRYLHAMGPGCASSHPSRTVDRCTMAGNMIAHNARRNGQFWGVNEGELINNIIYNPNEVGISAKAHRASKLDAVIRGNLIQLGPTSKAAARPMDLGGNTKASSRLAIEENFLGQYRSNSVEPYNDPPSHNTNVPNTKQVTPARDILSMAQRGSNHLRCLGASRPRRDSHDQRVIEEFHQQSGQVGIMGNHERDFSEYSPEPILQKWADSDRDGMPDSWELKMGVKEANQYDLSLDYTNLEVFLNRIALCPSISFDSETISLPVGTREVQIPFNTTWETWAGGQTFEVCVENVCEIYHDPSNSGTFTASLPAEGLYQLSMTPIGADGLREPIFGLVNLSVGQ